MTIQRRIQITTVVLVLFVLAAISTLFWSSRQVEHGIKRTETTSQLVRGAFMLKTLMDEYLDHGSERVLRQWDKLNKTFGEMLDYEVISESIERPLLEDLKKVYRSVNYLYPRVVEMRASSDQNHDLKTKKMLTNLMSLHLEQLVIAANNLSEATQLLTLNRRYFVQQLIVALGISTVLIILINIYLIRKSVVRPLKVLSNGAESIGAGSFDYIKEIKSDDEVGKLSQAFNTMVESIRERTTALKESEERLRMAQSSANVGAWERHLQTGKLIWTEEMEKIYGYAKGTFPRTYEGFSQRVHPDDLAEFERVRDKAVSQSKPFEFDYRIQLPSGEMKWVNCKGAAHYDETGNPDRVFGVNVDITERKQAEQALKESEASLKRSQEMAHLGSWELDVINNELTWSDEVYRIFGLQPQEFKATYEAFLEAVHPDDRKAVEEAYSGSLRDGRDTYEIEHRLVRKSTGEIRIVQEKCNHIQDQSGRIIRSVGMVHDITERKRAELRIKEMNETLEIKVAERTADLTRSNQDLQQFAYVASHDLQEPLRNVASCLQLLEKKYKGNLDAKADQLIHYAVESSVRMKALIQDLLTFSRIGTKGKPPKQTDCEQILDQTVKNLRSAISQAGAVVTHDPLPAVLADDTQLLQVFQNLIGNAVKFRTEEPSQIHVSAVKNENEWIFSVKDNGIGIESRHLDRIFMIFQRLHKRSQYHGTGMGLAIVKKVVERHNGRVWVESEFGRGSTFYFTIPEKGTQT